MEKQRTRHIKISKATEGRREAKGRQNVGGSVPEKEAYRGEVAPGSRIHQAEGLSGAAGVLGSLQMPETVACSW